MRVGQLSGSLVALIVGVMSGSEVTLSEPAGSRDFYDHNYAASVGGQQGRSKLQVSRDRDAVTIKTIESGDSESGKARGAPDRSKRRRLWVSVYVNSKDLAHFKRAIDEILRLHDTKVVRISNVSHIGDYRTVTDDVQKKLAARDIAIGQVEAPPKTLGITMSPAWCVQTREGVHIIEGSPSVEPFIDAWGEFKLHEEEQKVLDGNLAGF
jgi:hypothetical protein